MNNDDEKMKNEKEGIYIYGEKKEREIICGVVSTVTF